MPLLALHAAQLDHATKARIATMEADFDHATKEAAAAKDPAVKRIWETTAHHLNEALGTLRFGPYSDQEPRQDADSAVDSTPKKGGGDAGKAPAKSGQRSVPAPRDRRQ